MKLERIPEYVTVTFVTLIGMLLALYFGKQSGSGQYKTVIMALGAITSVILMIRMRTDIWLLIPLLWPMSGILSQVPSHPPFRDLVVLLVFVAFLAFKALKISRIKPVFGWNDFVLLINLLYILSVFIRNPVGTESLGTSKVGGRPYIEILFALLAYWVIVRVRISPLLAQKLPFYFLAGQLFSGALSLATDLFPSLGIEIGRFYGGGAPDPGAPQQQQPEAEFVRLQYLAPPSVTTFSLLCARFVPSTIFNPLYFFRFIFACLCIFGALKSGHRIAIISMIFAFMVSMYVRRGAFALVKGFLVLAPILAVIIGLQGNVLQLPLTAQRALCFLPGKWNEDVVSDAQGSTNWRIEIWKSVWYSDKYIENKTFGDGFGFTRRQLEQMAASDDTQENFRISGDYHNGPLSAVRFVGCVGLGLFYLLLFSLLKSAWRLINDSKGTPFFFISLFIGSPLVVLPLHFTAIFGAYQNDIVDAIISVGMLNMLRSSLEAYRKANPPANAPADYPSSRPNLKLRELNPNPHPFPA